MGRVTAPDCARLLSRFSHCETLLPSFSCSPKKTNQKKGGRSFFTAPKCTVVQAPAELAPINRASNSFGLFPEQSISPPKNDMAINLLVFTFSRRKQGEVEISF